MSGGDYGYDAAVKVYDVVRKGDHLQGQVVSTVSSKSIISTFESPIYMG